MRSFFVHSILRVPIQVGESGKTPTFHRHLCQPCVRLARIREKFLQVALRKRPCFRVLGDNFNTADGSVVRDFVHVVDLARCYVATLRKMKEEPAGLEVQFCLKLI